MKKTIKILLLLGFIISLRAEYIVYKKTKDGKVQPFDLKADKELYQKIYTVLQNYQWPMVLNNAIKSGDVLESLTPENAFGEEKLLRKKLKEIAPDIDIAFVPTIVYEMFVITEVSNYPDTIWIPSDLMNVLLARQKIEVYPDPKVIEIVKNPRATDQSIYDYYQSTNIVPDLALAHLIVNNGLLTLFGYDKPLTNVQEYLDQEMIGFFRLMSRWIKSGWTQTYIKNEDNRKKFIALEYEAREKNYALLYRGGKHRGLYMVGAKQIEVPIEGSFLASSAKVPNAPLYQELEFKYKTKGTPWKTRDWNMPLNSVSYGNSVFAGFWHESDPTTTGGACVCDYYNFPDLINYTLYIDKKNYVQNKKSLFFIASLNTLASLSGKGEFFHSRTRSFALPQHIHTIKYEIINIPGIAYPSYPGVGLPIEEMFDKAGIFLVPGDPLVKATELSDFIYKNAILLKVPDIGFAVTQPVIKQYKNAQNDLTNMLKATQIIRKQVRIKQKAKESKK